MMDIGHPKHVWQTLICVFLPENYFMSATSSQIQKNALPVPRTDPAV